MKTTQPQMSASIPEEELGTLSRSFSAGDLPLSDWPARGTGIPGVGTGGEGGKICATTAFKHPKRRKRRER